MTTTPSPTGTAHSGTGPEGPVPELYVSGRAKKARSRRNRFIAYGLGLSALALFAATADWGRIGDKYFDVERARDMFPDIVTIAAKNTVIYTVFSFALGVVLGLTAALMRLSSIRPYRWAAAVYIEIFRGLPALLTIIFVGFITPIALGVSFPEVLGVPTAGIVALGLVAGAYLAETIRAGIQAVPKGQVEAARSLGMTHGQTLRTVVIPQAFRIVVPPLTNEVVLLIKDTALLSVLGTTPLTKELTALARSESGKGFNGTPLVIAGLMYLVITIPLTRYVAYLERKNERTR